MKAPVLFMYGKNANMNPETPWSIAPTLKHILGPIFVPYLPKTGLNTNNDRFAIPKTNPYSAAVAPFFSASEGKNGGCSEMSRPNAIYL